MCFSASLISSPPLCFSYTPSQSHKGMRGRNEREESKQACGGAEREEWSRTKTWRWRKEGKWCWIWGCCASRIKSRQSSVCLAYVDEHMSVWLYACFLCVLWLHVMCVCVGTDVFVLYSVYVCMCMRADSAGSAAHHATANCWLHSTCFVLDLLCSAPIISLGACAELDWELCLTHCYSSLPLQLFSPWLCAAEDTSADISSRLRTQQMVRHLSPTVLAHSLDLSLGLKPVYSAWWHYDNQEGISSVPLPVWRLPGVCFGMVWHAELHRLTDSLVFPVLWHS